VRWSRRTAVLVVAAVSIAAWSAGELSGQTARSSAAKFKYLPAYLQAPSGFCATRNVARAAAHASRRKFVVYETSGDARGPHIFTASVTSIAYYCADGRIQVNWAFVWDMTHISGTTITAQVQVTRADGTRRASRIFDLKPRSAWRCCAMAKYLPTLEFPKGRGRVTSIAVVPLFNKNPTVYSAVDTKGGLHADYRLLPSPR
jgi:hypothetical protein